MEIGDYVSGFKKLACLEGTNNNCSKISIKLDSLGSSLSRLSLPTNQIEVSSFLYTKERLFFTLLDSSGFKKVLPAEIGFLKCLVNLDLRNNLIKKLPVEIGALNILQSLNLSNNLISSLPHEF